MNTPESTGDNSEYAYDGRLWIDTDNGVATFTTRDGTRILRITHLPDPAPQNVSIDIVALQALTSYTPLTRPDVKAGSAEGYSRGGKNKTSNTQLEIKRHAK